jgi:hypothetical protein
MNSLRTNLLFSAGEESLIERGMPWQDLKIENTIRKYSLISFKKMRDVLHFYHFHQENE